MYFQYCFVYDANPPPFWSFCKKNQLNLFCNLPILTIRKISSPLTQLTGGTCPVRFAALGAIAGRLLTAPVPRTAGAALFLAGLAKKACRTIRLETSWLPLCNRFYPWNNEVALKTQVCRKQNIIVVQPYIMSKNRYLAPSYRNRLL